MVQPTIDLKSMQALSFYDVNYLCTYVFDSEFHSSITQFLLLLIDCFLIMVEHFLVLGREALALDVLIFCTSILSSGPLFFFFS